MRHPWSPHTAGLAGSHAAHHRSCYIGKSSRSRSNWTHTALQHRPSSTSAAGTRAGGDVICIKQARFYGYHGVLPEENVVGQPFVVDVNLHCDLRTAGASDDLRETVSYAEAFSQVQAILEGPPHQLLESVAHAVAGALLTRHARLVHTVDVSVSKVHIPKLSASVQSVGVEVSRTRADFGL